jgi:glycosyltransferase involved in cell wall biosynthesis
MSGLQADYLLAVQAPAYQLPGGRFATESAFANHLRELRSGLDSRFKRIVLLAPMMPEASYRQSASHLSVIDESIDGIAFQPAFPLDVSTRKFWTDWSLPLFREIRSRVGDARLVHSGLCDDLWRPMMAMVNWVAWRKRRPLVFIVDIDFRRDSWRYRVLRIWGMKSYLLNRLVYDPIKWMQVWLAVRAFDLVLLKSQAMVSDFGAGRSNVRNFFDTVHGPESILSDAEVRARVRNLADESRPLRLVYFGRLVSYKGLERTIDGVVSARKNGANLELTILGAGECESSLREQVRRANADSFVTFLPPLLYGAELFSVLASHDIMIATPLTEDTPRAAFDAMARGLPIVAFDINYYRDLAASSGAVTLVEWPSAERLASALKDICASRLSLVAQVEHAVRFASDNTQQVWVARRMSWISAF